MHHRVTIIIFYALLLPFFTGVTEPQQKDPTPVADFNSFPRWRGFNLLEKFVQSDNRPYREADFKLIAELGFNFVRLPIDYRCFVDATNPRALRENVLKEIDAAVAYGKKYKVHVSINFHRAPGYCVNPPSEKTDLWQDNPTQELFAYLWGQFAARYRGIPNQTLSFNLINEPGDIDSATYTRVMMKAVTVIREQDPNRFVLIDGLRWGTIPVRELKGKNIIQALRGYAPFEISHYKAEWVEGSDRMPIPTWPIYNNYSPYLYGPAKPEYQSALSIAADFFKETKISVKIHQVSAQARLLIKADGKTILDKSFEPGPGAGEWSTVLFEKQMYIYQNIYDKYYSAVIPAGTKTITLENSEGDWLFMAEIRLSPYNSNLRNEIILTPNSSAWGTRQTSLSLTAAGTAIADKKNILYDSAWMRNDYLKPWIAFKKEGGLVFVGEFGVYKYTPHDVVLAWMEDYLKNWQEAGIGWAMWNFRGSIGLLDSERKDVTYSNFHGHKLDKEMLDLLLKY